MQAMPVKTVDVAFTPVAQSSEYVATIMSRRSATIQPQVSGRITQITARSGDHVTAGQVLMHIDAQPQMATVEAQLRHRAAEEGPFRLQHHRARARSTSFSTPASSAAMCCDQAQQSYDNSKADYESVGLPAQDPAGAALLLHRARAVRRRSRRRAGARGRLCFHLHRAHHRRSKQGSRSLHLHSHRARQRSAHGPGRGALRHRRQAAGEDRGRLCLAASGQHHCRASWSKRRCTALPR